MDPVDTTFLNAMSSFLFAETRGITGQCLRQLRIQYDLVNKFAVDRMLPKIDIGDYLVIHDTGAHGYAMGYNYNGKLKSPELLLQEDGSVKMIRRGETPKDYFSTFDFCDILDNIDYSVK